MTNEVEQLFVKWFSWSFQLRPFWVQQLHQNWCPFPERSKFFLFLNIFLHFSPVSLILFFCNFMLLFFFKKKGSLLSCNNNPRLSIKIQRYQLTNKQTNIFELLLKSASNAIKFTAIKSVLLKSWYSIQTIIFVLQWYFVYLEILIMLLFQLSLTFF